MLRAQNLGGLVNHTPPAPTTSGGGGSGGRAATVTTAEVVLHFDVMHGLPPLVRPQQLPNATGAGSASLQPKVRAGETGGGGGTHAAEPAVVGRLLVRRRVTRTGRSDWAVQQLPAETVQEGQQSGGCSAPWKGTTPAALRELLAPFGIQTEAVDRHGGRFCCGRVCTCTQRVPAASLEQRWISIALLCLHSLHASLNISAPPPTLLVCLSRLIPCTPLEADLW